MVRISKVYTGVGDEGETHLGDGSKASKASARVGAYGTVDEANAFIGRAIACVDDTDGALAGRIRAALLGVQNELFDVGADLCTPIADGERPGERLRILPEQSRRVEGLIDALNEGLPTLNSFVLPGGTMLATELHVARTVVRRAERLVVSLLAIESNRTNPETLVYLNRLSDLLFVMARAANAEAAGDVLWAPGASRGEKSGGEGGSSGGSGGA